LLRALVTKLAIWLAGWLFQKLLLLGLVLGLLLPTTQLVVVHELPAP